MSTVTDEASESCLRGRLSVNPLLVATRESYGISTSGVSVTMTFVIMKCMVVRSAPLVISGARRLYLSIAEQRYRCLCTDELMCIRIGLEVNW